LLQVFWKEQEIKKIKRNKGWGQCKKKNAVKCI